MKVKDIYNQTYAAIHEAADAISDMDDGNARIRLPISPDDTLNLIRLCRDSLKGARRLHKIAKGKK